MLDRIVAAQTKVQNELKLESEEVYGLAIQSDPALLSFTAQGLVTTPPIKDYDQPDGEIMYASLRPIIGFARFDTDNFCSLV
uniref:Large ribosomal subunit protein mL40 n=1 Tax=Anopheles epiroticus TaxID=199890 RepID=A0A182PFB9_9DIPT